MEPEEKYIAVLDDIIECTKFLLSNVKPSEWAETNRMMTSDVSPIPGMLSYKNSPYTKEIVDCFAPDHPARIIAVMKGAQIGFSTTVIEAAIGWIISQNPGNILFLVGHDELVEEAIVKVDRMIDNSGIRHLIKSNINRKRNSKTGDTNRKKEYPGGYLVSGVPNHKTLRNRSIKYGFVDDFEAAKGGTKQSGATTKMIEQRFAAYAKTMKLAYISTPELKQTSNIEPVYLMGDQRKYHIHCPRCAQLIPLEWEIASEKDKNEKAGMTWKLDDNNRLIASSVRYICQKCAGEFDDKNKNALIMAGQWIPTATPIKPGYYSYHISSLYAPTYMYDWEHYVREYMDANPIGAPRDEEKWKTFCNLCLGQTYEEITESPQATDLMTNNVRNYEIGLLPEKVSERDGNGKIVLLTCACDLNGVEDDARLDYEIVAWSESGASYSINHGSIGTFVPRENTLKFKEDRERWTYEHYKSNSVWKEFDKIINDTYITDTGRRMKIFITGVDTGHYNKYAYPFVDNNNNNVVSLKGKDADKYIPFGKDVPSFKRGREKSNLYLIEVGHVKDELSQLMKLKWNPHQDEFQPPGFMNFPLPTNVGKDGKYQMKNFFSHYESEHRIIETKDGKSVSAMWVKKSVVHQNHFWDVRVYNMALKDIFTDMVCTQLKIKNFTWADYVAQVLGKTN